MFFENMMGILLAAVLVPTVHTLLSWVIHIACGGRTAYVEFGNVTYTRTGGRMKKGSRGFTPVLSVSVPIEDIDDKKDRMITVIWLVLCTVLDILLAIIIYKLSLSAHPLIRAMLTGFFMFIIINYFLTLWTVGRTLKNGQLRKYLRMYSRQLKAGIRFSEMDISLEQIPENAIAAEKCVYLSYIFSKALELRDFSLMNTVAGQMHQMAQKAQDVVIMYEVPMYYHLIYYYSCVNFNPDLAMMYRKRVWKILESDTDANAYRVEAYFLHYVMRDDAAAREKLAQARASLQREREGQAHLAPAEVALEEQMVHGLEGELC